MSSFQRWRLTFRSFVYVQSTDTPIKCDEANGWREYDNKCYLYKNDRTKFVDAESYCNLVGGNLVSVSSEGEQLFLMSLQSTVDIQYWIGLTDLVRT